MVRATQGHFMKSRRAEAARAASAHSPLNVLNADRRRAAAVDALRMRDRERLSAAGIELPICALEAYEKGEVEADTQIDAGREPFLVMSEALDLGMHPLLEIWDVGMDRVAVGNGSGRTEMVRVTSQSGDLLLPPDTVVAWR